MHYFPMSYQESIDPAVGIPLAIVLWLLLLFMTLVSLRLAKVRRDKARRARMRSTRRETYIQLADEAEIAYLDSLDTTPKENPHDRRYNR
jgi:hypothetical protein